MLTSYTAKPLCLVASTRTGLLFSIPLSGLVNFEVAAADPGVSQRSHSSCLSLKDIPPLLLSIIYKECLDKISLPGNCDKVLSVKQEWLQHTSGQLE